MMIRTGVLVSGLVVLGLCFGGAAAMADGWDHVHLVAPDTMAAAKWYQEHFGGEITKSGPFDAILIGGKMIKFKEGEAEGTEGCAVNHIAIAVPDVAAKIAALKEEGIAVKHPSRRRQDVGFLTDPWGTKIEVLQDEAIEGFHHVHLHTSKPLKTARWYAAAFGGELEKYQGVQHLPAIKYDNMWVVFQQRAGAASTKNRSVDHIGWRFKDFDALVQKLKGQDTKFLVGPQKSGDHMMAFIEGPDGVKIELVEIP